MDAHLFRLFCSRACPLLEGARIGKIQEPDAGHLNIAFYKSGKKLNLVCKFGRKEPFCFITAKRPKALPVPSAQVMRLRKYCASRHIQFVACDPWARRLWLLLGGAGTQLMTWVCLDLAAGPEVHFLADPPLISAPAWPRGNEIPEALNNWQNWPVLTPALRRAMHALDLQEQKALLADLEDGGGEVFAYAGEKGIEKISAWPILAPMAQSLKENVSDDILGLIEKAGQDMVLTGIYRARLRVSADQENRRQKKLVKTLARLEQDERRLHAMTALEPDAMLLAAHLWQWPRDAKLDHAHIETASGVKNITLDKRYTVSQNLERMFHNIKRGKRGLALVDARRAQLQGEMAEAMSQAGTAAAQSRNARPEENLPNHAKRVQVLRSQDGFVLLRGKDAQGNLAIRKGASGHDIWVHVETGPGAHVLIRRRHAGEEVPESTLVEAGQLAAEKSWLKDAPAASVMYAELRHIKPIRNGPPGKVTIDKILETRMVRLKQD